MPLTGWTYHRVLTDTNSTNLTNFVVKHVLTSSNFDFSLAKSDGSDLRVRDETTSTVLPIYVQDYDPTAQTGTIYYLAANTSHAHSLYYGNASAANVSTFLQANSGVFVNGTGFDADFGDLSTATAGTYGAATRIAASSGNSDIRNQQIWRIAESPFLQLSDLTSAGVPAGNYTGLREFSPVRDSSNKVISVGGKYYAFFARRPTNAAPPYDKIDTYRGESTSGPYGPFTNFTQVYSPPSTVRLGYVGCTLKIGSTYYLYLTYGWDTGGTTTPGLSIYYMTSSDCLTWSSITQCVVPSSYKDDAGNACSDIGNPWVIPLADGTYMMTFEAELAGTTHWSCNGATSPNGTTWTPLNSGNPLVVKGSSGTWDSYWAANPKCFQRPDGSILIQYNGAENGTNNDQQLGFATASTPAGPYTEATFNPVSGRPYGAYGHECAAYCYDSDGSSVLNVIQRFATTSNTGSFYRCYQERRRGGLLISRDDPTTGTGSDGAVMGKVVAGGAFTASTSSAFTANRTNNSTPILLGLYNSAALPTPAANAGFASNRVCEINRWSHDAATPGDLLFRYYSTGGTATFWDGSAWTTTTSSIACDHAREVVARISDDGTNFVLVATYADDGSTIASASIAKSSVRTWTNRLVWAGDPFTDAWECGLFFRYFHVRPYAATEPAMSAGAMVQDQATWYTLTPPSPATGTAGSPSGQFTVAVNAPYTGTITLTPSGGGLSAPIVLTFSSAAPQQFTITPTSAGTVTLTGSNSGGLIDPGSATYTATPAAPQATTTQVPAVTYAFTSDRASFMGYTLRNMVGDIVSARTTAGIALVGNGFFASVNVPWSGSFIVDWDDTVSHDAMLIAENYVEANVTANQALASLLATGAGKTSDNGLTFYDPTGNYVRVQGTTSGNDRTSVTLTPPS